VRASLTTAGERVGIDCDVAWVAELLEEGAAGQLASFEPARPDTLTVRIEANHDPFSVDDWPVLTRGAWYRDGGGSVVVADACTSGFDVWLQSDTDHPVFTFRWRPPRTSRVANLALRSRFVLLARAALVQYPALWAAGLRGRAPLHVSACTVGAAPAATSVVLAGPGGVGKSTLLAGELAAGGRAASDNLCVSDGSEVWGVVEPLRLELGPGQQGQAGRRMPHGRHETNFDGRVPSLVPNHVLVLRRGQGERPEVAPATSETATRSLVAGTYVAGELRRYWGLAATLAAGTGSGPVHPPVGDVAQTMARRTTCIEVILARRPGARLADLLELTEAVSCT
jgi:hypothetical protein